MSRSRAELDALEDLLRHFGAGEWGPEHAEEAFDLIADRARVLAESYVEAADAVGELVNARTLTMPEAMRRLLLVAHERLYYGILTNAGEPRQPGDSGGSRIYFGGFRGNRRAIRFEGTRADEIEPSVWRACERLEDRRGGDMDGARDASILFYAELSKIHPFYDGNGRAGRFVVSVYLHLHGWLVEWASIDGREGQFMRRINQYNEREWSQQDYEAFLLSFWRKYVVRTEGLD